MDLKARAGTGVVGLPQHFGQGIVAFSNPGGSRLEFDGQIDDAQPAEMRLTRVEDYATLVSLGGDEPLLAGLRRRRLLIDSPRVLARDDRDALKQP